MTFWGVEGGHCRFNLQRRYEESEQQLGSVHRRRLQREMEGHNIYGTSSGAGSIRERKTGCLEEGGGHLETGWGGPGEQCR